MIDFHSHILPGIDDGSKSVEESIELLRMLSVQEVDTVAATPHFYASDGSPEEFFERRDASAGLLKAAMPRGLPKIFLGAEVLYYQGISGMRELGRMRIEGTRLLLLEMPVSVWSEYAIREVENLCSGEFIVMIAHLERYIFLQKTNVLERLLSSGVIMQTNASALLHFGTRRKILNMFKRGEVHLIGSDCHSIDIRPPRMQEAYSVIRKHLGDVFAEDIDFYGRSFWEG